MSGIDLKPQKSKILKGMGDIDYLLMRGETNVRWYGYSNVY